MSAQGPILVTGAAGKIGAVARTVVELLRAADLPVRAMVRVDDDRAEALRKTGAEVVVGDLTNPQDVVKALAGCRRVFFSMSVSPPYLEATMIMAAAAKEQGDIESLVNISQLTVSQMTLTKMTDSPQQRQHFFAEQALNWSGLPVSHVRATIFMDHPFFSWFAAESIAKDDTIKLPFGAAKTSPIAATDVAAFIAELLKNPPVESRKVYEITGPESITITEMAREFSKALGKKIEYVDMPFAQWKNEVLDKSSLPEHVRHHFETMAQLHADNRYDRFTTDFEKLLKRKPISIFDYVSKQNAVFAGSGK